jgi:glyoxylase-like metal-dependent hydrolase (beta-lactamase superfamily II)
MVFPLSEGTYTVDISKRFIPFDASKDILEDRPSSLLIDIVPFLVRTKNDLIIIDPGLGLQSSQGDFQIYENIRNHGFSPDDVSMVLLSHLHKDHAGGICYGANRAFNLMFPNASYFCQQNELDYAFTKKDSPSYLLDRLEFLKDSPNLKFLNGDGNINPDIRYEMCGGHTPYHQVFLIKCDGKELFYGGDVVPKAAQIITRFVAKYDFDGKKSAQLREEYARRGAVQNWIFLFFHDGEKPFARVRYENNRFTILDIV